MKSLSPCLADKLSRNQIMDSKVIGGMENEGITDRQHNHTSLVSLEKKSKKCFFRVRFGTRADTLNVIDHFIMSLLEIFKKKQFSQRHGQKLEQGCGISTVRDIQNLTRQGSEQPDLTPKPDLTSRRINIAVREARGLAQMTFRGPF